MNQSYKDKMKSFLKYLFVGLFLIGLIIFIMIASEVSELNIPHTGTPQEKAEKMQKTYEIADIDNNKSNKCLLAKLISSEYKKANEPENYKKWKIIEKKDCEEYINQ